MLPLGLAHYRLCMRRSHIKRRFRQSFAYHAPVAVPAAGKQKAYRIAPMGCCLRFVVSSTCADATNIGATSWGVSSAARTLVLRSISYPH